MPSPGAIQVKIPFSGSSGPWLEDQPDGSGNYYWNLLSIAAGGPGSGTMDWTNAAQWLDFTDQTPVTVPAGAYMFAASLTIPQMLADTGHGATLTLTFGGSTSFSAGDLLPTFGTDPATYLGLSAHIDATVPGGAGATQVISTHATNTPRQFLIDAHFKMAVSVTSVSPDHGKVTGGTPVTISGSNFWTGYTDPSNKTRAKIGGNFCSSVVVTGSGSLTCTTPGGIESGPADVDVLSPWALGDATLVDGFIYTPVLSSASPAIGSIEGGYEIILFGQGFFKDGLPLDDMVVMFGANAGTLLNIVANTALVITVPAADLAGPVDVTISGTVNGVAYTETLVDGFTYNAINRAPIIDAGPDQNVPPPLPSTITLTGSWTQPPPGGTITFQWTQLSGPVPVTIVTPTAMATDVTFGTDATPGVYVLKLTSSADPVVGVAATADTVRLTIPTPRAPRITEVHTSVKLP